MSIRLVNPLNETGIEVSPPAPRLTGLTGKRIALLDISKPGGAVFLDRLEFRLKADYAVAEVIRETKPTFAKPAPEDVIDRLKGVDAVIESLAD